MSHDDTEFHRQKTRFLNKKWFAVSALFFLLVIAAGGFFGAISTIREFFSKSSVDHVENPNPDDSQSLNTKPDHLTPKRSEDIDKDSSVLETKFAFVTPMERFGSASEALVGGDWIPFAVVDNALNGDDPTYYVDGAYVLRFKLQKRPEFERISIDQISVVVHEWQQVPEFVVQAAAFPSQTSLYVVTIAKPPPMKEQSFVAEHFFKVIGNDQSEAVKFSPIIVDEEHPETVDVRVNATEHGRYLISVEIEISHDLAKERICLHGPTPVLFINSISNP